MSEDILNETMPQNNTPEMKQWKADYDEALRKKKEETKRFDERMQGLVVTTTGSIDGYRAVAQLGVVVGETMFSSNIAKGVFSVYANTSEDSNLAGAEGSDPMIYLEKAREYAVNKMKEAAVRKGANAVIGMRIKSDVTDGGLIHVVVYGTAVQVAK